MLSQLRRCRRLGFVPGLIVLLLVVSPVLATQDDAGQVTRVRELFDSLDIDRFAAPVPDSRSIVVGVDATSDLYLFVERGSIRGNAIDTFYEQVEAGEWMAAYETFSQNSITVLSASDYGWNGLGVPMEAENDRRIDDVYYEVVDGRFQRVEIEPEDVERFNDLLRDVVIPALEKVAGGP